MPRFRITISSQSKEAMVDLVRVHHVPIDEHTVRREGPVMSVDAVVQSPQIDALEAAGYRVERHEDADEGDRLSLKQVGQGNRYKQAVPRERS